MFKPRGTNTRLGSLWSKTGFWLVLAISLACAPFVRGDAKVTLCHAADEPGAGVNLQNAMAFQPDPNTQVNTITFQCNGTATIQITQSYSLLVGQATVIDGGGTITLDGGGNQRMFQQTPMFTSSPPSLSLNNLTLRNAQVPPGQCSPILCPGSVVAGAMPVQINHCQIENSGLAVTLGSTGTLTVNSTQFVGAAIFSEATQTTISNSGFQNNGGVPIVAGGTVSISGSIFSNNDVSHFENCQQLTIKGHSTFSNNTKGGALRVGCNSTISNSTFANNASADGGAIHFTGAVSQVSLRASKFVSNSASGSGGAIAFEPSNTSNRNVEISFSSFTDNKATTGGAIAVLGKPGSAGGSTTIAARVVSFSRNSAAQYGGAISGIGTALNLTRGVFADNQAGWSGGAVILEKSPQIRSFFGNTLFVRNKSGLPGSAFVGELTDFINSTVDSNEGLAIAATISAPAAPIRLTNSIVSNNSHGGCGPAGFFEDRGRNLQFPGTDCGPSIRVADPHLDTMYIPLPQSPPMGSGDFNVCNASPINGLDVYGLGRPAEGVCAIGAAEGDIRVLTNRRCRSTGGRTMSTRACGQCDCGLTLLKQLLRLLPYNP